MNIQGFTRIRLDLFSPTFEESGRIFVLTMVFSKDSKFYKANFDKMIWSVETFCYLEFKYKKVFHIDIFLGLCEFEGCQLG